MVDGQMELCDYIKPEDGSPARWVPIRRGERGYSAGDFRCTGCGKANPCYSLTLFCPNCGREMENGHRG